MGSRGIRSEGRQAQASFDNSSEPWPTVQSDSLDATAPSPFASHIVGNPSAVRINRFSGAIGCDVMKPHVHHACWSPLFAGRNVKVGCDGVVINDHLIRGRAAHVNERAAVRLIIIPQEICLPCQVATTSCVAEFVSRSDPVYVPIVSWSRGPSWEMIA